MRLLPVGALVGVALSLSIINGLAAKDTTPLVDVSWLKPQVCTEGLTVLDVRRSTENYRASHLPCAVHTNYYKDGWRTRKQGIPHMMPPTDQLEALIGRLGIKNNTHVVIYGSGTGPFDAAETTSIYLTFKYLGHDSVSILDGGLPAWMAEWSVDFDVGMHKITAAEFIAKPRAGLLISREGVQSALANNIPIIDVRSNDMFLGVNRAWMLSRSGTIPGALNLPMSWLTVNAGLKFRDREQLQQLFSAAGAPDSGKQIYFCNAGLESSMAWFVAHELLENEQAVLYDGSLAEWTKDKSLPLIRHVELN